MQDSFIKGQSVLFSSIYNRDILSTNLSQFIENFKIYELPMTLDIKTRSSATAERQGVSYARLSRRLKIVIFAHCILTVDS